MFLVHVLKMIEKEIFSLVEVPRIKQRCFYSDKKMTLKVRVITLLQWRLKHLFFST